MSSSGAKRQGQWGGAGPLRVPESSQKDGRRPDGHLEGEPAAKRMTIEELRKALVGARAHGVSDDDLSDLFDKDGDTGMGVAEEGGGSKESKAPDQSAASGAAAAASGA